MSILAKYNAAMEAKDEAAMNEILHDDYKFTMHASGNVLGKADVIKWAMSPASIALIMPAAPAPIIITSYSLFMIS